MSAAAGRRRGRRRRHGGQHEDEERWLLTYADMITLLMALFMVLFSISAVNKAKFQQLQQSLQDAFSAKILPGGTAIRDNGGGPDSKQSSPLPPIPAMQPLVGQQSTPSSPQAASQQHTPQLTAQQITDQQLAAAQEQSFERLKRQIDHWTQTH